MRIFKKLHKKNRKILSNKKSSETIFSNNGIMDFVLKIIVPNFTIFSGVFLIGLPFFKLSILGNFKISPLLLSFSKFEVLIFLVALSFFQFSIFFAMFLYDIKKYLQNNTSINKLPLICFIMVLLLGLFFFFFNNFLWIFIFLIVLSFLSLKYKRTYMDFLKNINFINILFMIAFTGLITAALFTNEYLERFIPFSIVEKSCKNSQIIDVIVVYYNDKPIIKKYDVTKKSENYFDNFFPGYEYDGEKHLDVVCGIKSFNCFKNKKSKK